MSNDTNKSADNKSDSSKTYVKTHENKDAEDYGYYFYPERKKEQEEPKESLTSRFKHFVFEDVWGRNRKAWNNLRCRESVRRCYEQNPLVKLMVQALEAHGCPVDLQKHIKCEPCKLKVSGGFDFYANHVVICENNAKWQTMVCNIMVHELLHAFDKCRSTMDFKNPEHHACTEVRAANLFHCPLSSALATAEALPWDYRLKHQACVRNKALVSVMLVRDISEEEGKKVVNKVFERCYNDLEPVGRRFRKKTLDGERAYSDGILYGYCEG